MSSEPLEQRVVTLPDGRELDVLAGPPTGDRIGLIAHHGTPGEASRFAPWADAVASRGLRTICFSRPGYATSTRHAGRTVASVADDVAALADALEIDRFVSIGRSGGGRTRLPAPRCWGFEVDAISRPVRIWQGEVDHLVSVAHGRWLADHIPNATFNLAAGHGHISLAEAHREEILDDLVGAAGLGD